MRKVLFKILIAICVIVGLGSLSQCAREEKASSSSDSSSSAPREEVARIELSDDGLIF